MNEAVLVIYVLLSIFTSWVMFVYYKRTRQGSKEYVKAKTALNEMVLSFNRDIEARTQDAREIANRSDATAQKSLEVVERMGSEIEGIKDQLDELSGVNDTLRTSYEALRKNVDDLSSQRSEILERISMLESSRGGVGMSRITTEPVIPLKREKALAPLTQTELRILELLASEGEKTAPQIKEKIGLTREHTARLMKKLFAEGYVERSTDGMPYLYRLKREMEDLLGERNISG